MTAAPTPPPPGASGSTPTLPGWYRGLDVFSGALAIVLAFVALIYPGAGVALLVFLFAFALLLLGSWRLMRALAGPERPGWHRGVDAVLGVLGIVVAFVVILLPGLGLLTLVLLLYFGLVFIGVGWVIFGARRDSDPGWYRGLAIALGIFSLIAAFIAIIDIRVALITLVLLLAFVLLLIGIGDLVSGVTGRPYRTLPIGWAPPGTGPV